jgi:hypothetical protein
MLDELNNQSSKKTSSPIDEEMKKWPKSPYIEAAIAEALRPERKPAPVPPAPARRLRLPVIIALALLGVGLALLLYIYLRPRPPQPPHERLQAQSTPQQQPSPTPASAFDPKTADVRVGEPVRGPGYVATPFVISSDGQDILELVQYEFHSSRFIAGSAELKNILDDKSLKNEEQLKAVFKSRKDELSKSWILIFTTASVERDPAYNEALCERRIYHVRDLIKESVGATPKGYWGILAGEFKIELPRGKTPQEEEEIEEQMAREKGEPWLGPQRKLIVIAIKEKSPLAPELGARVPYDVALSVSSRDMLPKTYDAPESRPFPLSEAAKGQ